MIGVNNLTVNFGERFLFNDVTLIINTQDRIGLVGRNGAGKSTLLKILAGVYTSHSGSVSYPSGTNIGYLPQDMDFVSGKTVLDETRSAFTEVQELEKQLEKTNTELETRTDYESDTYMELIEKLTSINERLTLLGAFSLDADIEKVLMGLGFSKSDFFRLTDEFSGGWRMRIELAKILLKRADLILLDEPTNHLDIESILWLEDFLKTFEGAVVLISHDKTFLDNVTKRTIEISLGKIYDYKAPYSKYVEMRKERRIQQMAAYTNQQKMIQDTEKFIERFRAKATKAVQVQSRIKQLDKVERIEIEEEDTSDMHFYFPPAPRSGKVVVEAHNVSKTYGNHTVFNHVNFYIEKGERIAFVGKNGEGKSTLAKMIVGDESGNGELKIGYNVNIGYYAQNQGEVLEGNSTLLSTIEDAAPDEMRPRVRNLLGAFMFTGEDAEKKVKVLSGGERARLALCKLLLQPINLLVMDEPTNHLDLRSKETLKEALKKYDGTLIVISHDRDFLDGLTEKVFEFKDGNVKEYIGDISEFLKVRSLENFRELEAAKQEKKNGIKEVAPVSKDQNKEKFEEKKQIEKNIRQLENASKKIEVTISQTEEKIRLLNEKLQNPETFTNEMLPEFDRLNQELHIHMQEWENAQLKLEDEKQKLQQLT
ncbi:MAG: ATP-binding cassette domain-containing protein [Flavobacteriales bacterium]|nr:ATP-binding cassette domain-containing protein [Flavobacteriales bacterium]